MEELEKLFEPIEIGKLKLKNRIVNVQCRSSIREDRLLLPLLPR